MISLGELWPRVRSGNLGRSIANEYRRRHQQPRRLLKRPLHPTDWPDAARRLNEIAQALTSTSYLEIGVRRGHTLENIAVASRVGVDPLPLFDTTTLPAFTRFFLGSSDEFFQQLDGTETFDLIFIDGLHTFEQTYRDLRNALEHAAPGAAILIDDVVPTDEIASVPNLAKSLQLREQAGERGGAWQGDVWKVVFAIDELHPELEYRTIIGEGNPQTLVWRKEVSGRAAGALPDDAVQRIAGRAYDETFRAGVPSAFRPADESLAIRDCAAALSWFRTQR